MSVLQTLDVGLNNPFVNKVLCDSNGVNDVPVGKILLQKPEKCFLLHLIHFVIC